jgi:LCP family protein required for cell wall assembly
MSRYDDREGIGDYPSAGEGRAGSRGRRGRDEDTGGWGGQGPARRSRSPQPARPAPRRRSTLLGTHRVLGLAAIFTTIAVVGMSLTAYGLLRNVYDGIHHETVTAQMLGPRPPKLNGSTNILLIGSDSRAGTHGQYGSSAAIGGSRSDTTMLLHISPDHAHAYVISFPRDSMVPVYNCKPDQEGHPGQTVAPGALEPLNATFSFGGAPCLWKTLERTTHIFIDHFVEVGFSSFQKIVNDVGGISVCLPFPIRNWRAHLYMKAGIHKVSGAQALAFVRLRENIGDGSDLQRIQRQQLFLASAMQKIKQANLLGDYKVITDAAHAVLTDLSLTSMLGIANSMKGMGTSSLRFLTVPTGAYPADVNKVIWTQPQADNLFSAIAHDNHIYKAGKAAKAAQRKSKAKPAPTVAPAQVQLEVLNGSGQQGVAGTTATGLSNLGFNVIGTGDAANFSYASPVIEYSTASQIPEVNTLKKQVPGVQVQQATGLQPGTIALILGSKFTSLVGGTAKQHGPSVATASQGLQGISGNQNICRDSSAFTGPLSPVPAPTG